jgi:hypothetical protein
MQFPTCRFFHTIALFFSTHDAGFFNPTCRAIRLYRFAVAPLARCFIRAEGFNTPPQTTVCALAAAVMSRSLPNLVLNLKV